jgi:hypothetical protein
MGQTRNKNFWLKNDMGKDDLGGTKHRFRPEDIG